MMLRWCGRVGKHRFAGAKWQRANLYATGERVNAAIEELGFVRNRRRRRCAAGKAASLV